MITLRALACHGATIEAPHPFVYLRLDHPYVCLHPSHPSCLADSLKAQSPQLEEEYLSQPLFIDPFHHKISTSPIPMSKRTGSLRQYWSLSAWWRRLWSSSWYRWFLCLGRRYGRARQGLKSSGSSFGNGTLAGWGLHWHLRRPSS